MNSSEIRVEVSNGWALLGVLLPVGLVLAAVMYVAILSANVLLILGGALMVVVWAVCLGGFFTLQPNQAAVLMLFGKYSGTVKSSGFKWANPFYQKLKISLRRRNLNSDTLKVNDLRGNPVEIGAVIVWRVENTAKATFDVDHYEHYVTIQSESALRHMAMAYPYDTYEEHDVLSLRGSTDEISKALEQEVQERVATAGVIIEETRLSHLAYAPEIAGAMLQRQQAEAIVAARSRIVEGAVGMVEMALDQLEKYGKLELDEERKAAMVSNLLVVLCGHESAHPVINTGTLHN